MFQDISFKWIVYSSLVEINSLLPTMFNVVSCLHLSIVSLVVLCLDLAHFKDNGSSCRFHFVITVKRGPTIKRGHLV